MNNTDLILATVFSVILISLQVTFGFMMRKHKEAFLKYHRVLGVVIFFVAFANMFALPAVSPIAVITVLAILTQIIIGFLLIKNEKLKKYHKPLGISILILIIANLVMVLF